MKALGGEKSTPCLKWIMLQLYLVDVDLCHLSVRPSRGAEVSFSPASLLKLPSVFLGHQHGYGFIRCLHTGGYSRNIP